jgi:hypothetical protein
MTLFASGACTGARDKMHGFLGVAADVVDAVFSLDYTEAPEVLFTEVTRFIITRDS